MRWRKVLWLVVVVLSGSLRAEVPTTDLREEVLGALKEAARFYRTEVATHGGYVYYYSLDLNERWGEGKASPDTVYVQPPGTPTVGMAYLSAYAATEDSFYLDGAREAAEALIYGQLESGGWPQRFVIGPANRRARKEGRSSLDDGQTQSALKMLIRADQAFAFQHADIHQAALTGLDALLKAQFPNGAFAQGWNGPAPAYPVLKARYPDGDWRDETRIKNYWDFYTLNDSLAGSVADTLITAHEVYQDERYLAALKKLGDFLILAQMPEPQPGWCQQYNFEMVPAWARKFEPPAVTGGESQDVMRTLIRIAQYTGQEKYLEPIPRALKYFRSSLLPDGRVARYYELKTNKPLYMNRQYEVTYDDSAVPSHYSWKQSARFDEIEAAYENAVAGRQTERKRSVSKLEDAVRPILQELDDQGRWVTTYSGSRLTGQPDFRSGGRFISSEVFARNVELLSEFLAATASE